jgi:hypothetical protein
VEVEGNLDGMGSGVDEVKLFEESSVVIVAPFG